MVANNPTPEFGQPQPVLPSLPAQVRFPRFAGKRLAKEPTQDREWCEVLQGGTCRRLRFHDYHEIYKIPGLYEHLFYDCLKCCSPSRVIGLLAEILQDFEVEPKELRAFDIGAGNGMVGEELLKRGVTCITGLDILPEARLAAQRDRPGVYREYLVADLAKLESSEERRLKRGRFNLLTLVAALGFGDIPPEAFMTALGFLDTPGWLAFNIKEDFLYERDTTGFCQLVRKLSREGVIEIQAYRRYRHRFSVSGKGLYYVAMVARKLRRCQKSRRAGGRR